MHQAAQCFGLWAEGRLAAFAATIHRPVSQGTTSPIWGVQRLVTLPDWQGLGLAMVLVAAVGADYRAGGMRLHTYPAHPALIRSFDRSAAWRLASKPQMRGTNRRTKGATGTFGGRPCAVFEYIGPAAEKAVLI